MRTHTECIQVYVTKDELRRIYEKKNVSGIKYLSTYVRKMALEGFVLKLDLSDLNEVARLLRINSNNLNQYAKKANETGSIYKNDIDELKNQQEELWELLKNIYQRLSSI